MKWIRMVLVGIFGCVLAGLFTPPMVMADSGNSFNTDREFRVNFVNLPLRGFFYRPVYEDGPLAGKGEGVNHVNVTVKDFNSTLRYNFVSMIPNGMHTLWFINIFMVTRQGPFPGTAPPSPQGNPYLGWPAGTAGSGYDKDGDGLVWCGEGKEGFRRITRGSDPAFAAHFGAVSTDSMWVSIDGTGQSPEFDPNSFCADIFGHAKPVVTVPYDVAVGRGTPAQNPPQGQTNLEEMRPAQDGTGVVEKRKHIVDETYMRQFENDPANPRFGFQKLDNLGRPLLRTFRPSAYIVCGHNDGFTGFTHGHNPGEGPDDNPSTLFRGTDHECLMAAMPTSQARSADEQ